MAWTTTALLFLGIAACSMAGQKCHHTRLANFIKKNSDPDVAPLHDDHTPVYVSFVYAVLNIADVDKEHNTFTTESHVSARWDTGITWDPADYGNIDSITLPAKYFWTPAMQPIHTAVEVKNLSPQTITLVVNGTAFHNGFYRQINLCDVSDIKTGSTCHARNNMAGYSRDQVAIGEIGGDTSGAFPYFEGSKYELIGSAMNVTPIAFEDKQYEIIFSTVVIREKPHAEEPMRMHFEFH